MNQQTMNMFKLNNFYQTSDKYMFDEGPSLKVGDTYLQEMFLFVVQSQL